MARAPKIIIVEPPLEPQPPKKVKFVKNEHDECFGEKYEQIDQCLACWIKNSCYACFKNRKE